MVKRATYSWYWPKLSLWRSGEGWSSLVFSLWPPWLWGRLRDWRIPDPYLNCQRWLIRNRHYDDEDFYRAVAWYFANGSDPGDLLRLNPNLFISKPRCCER